MKSKLREFIENNSISFEEGERNSTVTKLIGYSQYLGLSQDNLENELSKEIKKDRSILSEINRIWGYCASRNYAKFWGTKSASNEYVM